MARNKPPWYACHHTEAGAPVWCEVNEQHRRYWKRRNVSTAERAQADAIRALVKRVRVLGTPGHVLLDSLAWRSMTFVNDRVPVQLFARLVEQVAVYDELVKQRPELIGPVWELIGRDLDVADAMSVAQMVLAPGPADEQQ